MRNIMSAATASVVSSVVSNAASQTKRFLFLLSDWFVFPRASWSLDVIYVSSWLYRTSPVPELRLGPLGLQPPSFAMEGLESVRFVQLVRSESARACVDHCIGMAMHLIVTDHILRPLSATETTRKSRQSMMRGNRRRMRHTIAIQAILLDHNQYRNQNHNHNHNHNHNQNQNQNQNPTPLP